MEMEGQMETNVSSVKGAPISIESEEKTSQEHDPISMKNEKKTSQEHDPISMKNEEKTSREHDPVSMESELLFEDDIPILTKENYMAWKDMMENFLKSEGLWGYVDGTIREPENTSSKEYKDWKQKKGEIESNFRIKCEARTQPYIEELDTRLIWSQLVTMYEFTHPTNSGMKMESTPYTWCLPFYRAIVVGDWQTIYQFISKNKGALTAILTPEGELPLHVAVQNRQVNVAKELIKIMSEDDLSRQRRLLTQKHRRFCGKTALHIAALDGNIETVKAIVEKDEKLAVILSGGRLPITLAAWHGKKDVVHYLYPITIHQIENLKEVYPGKREKVRASFLNALVIGEFYGLALDLLQKYRSLILAHSEQGHTAIGELSLKRSAFRSSFPTKSGGGGILGYYFQNFMYPLLDVHVYAKNACKHTRGDVENSFDANGHNTQGNINCGLCTSTNGIIFQCWKGLSLCFHRLFQNALIKLVPGCKNIYDEKLKHYEASELLKELWRLISDHDHDPEVAEEAVIPAMFRAIRYGIVEFIEEVVNHWPQLLLKRPPAYESQTVFHYAISNRQEKIFGLIHHLGPLKDEYGNLKDASGNTMSHLAAKLAPIHRLNQVPGAALQMQRELLWYKEVENVMYPNHESFKNNKKEKPRMLFTEEHKELLKEGAKWMKETATQCMVVATLITTIMFAAVFTVPGTNKEMNENHYIQGKFPIIFVISNIIALSSSVASMLMFLAIITSRYAEEDFLWSLPRMLMMGLFFLFISIVGMMIAFVAAIFFMLPYHVLWISFPIIFIAIIPVTLYARVELRLFIQLIFATASSDVFGKS